MVTPIGRQWQLAVKPLGPQIPLRSIAPNREPVLDSSPMCVSGYKLFDISSSAPGLGLLSLLLRR
jgi:hypothetical protein